MREYLYLLATDRKNGTVAAVVKGLLWGVSLIYAGVMTARRIFYRTGLLKAYNLPRPVISVGNITLGGVGKTPITIYLAELLKSMGKKPAILIRGYMPDSTDKAFSDEARLLELRLRDVPVLAGKDRVKNALNFLKKDEADVFIMDDGFQHQRLKRDLDIVAVDSTNPWGNGCVLPRGILRESAASLRNADIIFLTKTDLAQEGVSPLKSIFKAKGCCSPVIETIHQPMGFIDMKSGQEYDTNFIRQKKVALLSSIADPKAFEKTVEHLGGEITRKFIFPDHYSYDSDDIARVAQECRSPDVSVIVTTQKDAVKLIEFKDVFAEGDSVIVLKINLKVCQKEELLVERIGCIF